MTMSEALITGLQTTVLGMATLFAVLAILMGAIKIMKRIFYKAPEKEATVKIEEAPATISTAEVSEEEDEEELIAVITAAIAASLNTSTYNLKIKSYRRIENRNPAWNKAAVRENTNLSL